MNSGSINGLFVNGCEALSLLLDIKHSKFSFNGLFMSIKISVEK